MPWVSESGYEFQVPAERSFRLEECSTYRESLNPHHVTEVDFAWLSEGDSPVLWMMEVKNIRGEAARDFDAPRWIDVLVEKVTDALMMVQSIWADSYLGKELLDDIRGSCPDFPDESIPVRIALAVGLDREDAAMLLQPIVQKVKSRLKGRLKLPQPMGITSSPVFLVSLRDAQRITGPIPIRSSTT